MGRGGSAGCEILPYGRPVPTTLPSDTVQGFSLLKKLPTSALPINPRAQQLLPHLGSHTSTLSGKYLQAVSSLKTSIHLIYLCMDKTGI